MNEPAAAKPTRSTAPQIVAGLVILIGVLGFYSTGNLLTILSMIFIDGGVALMWISSAALLGAAVIRVSRIQMDGLLMFATGSAIGLGIFSMSMLGLGLVGWANRGTVTCMMLIGAIVGVAALWPNLKLRTVRFEPKARSIRWLWLAALPFLGMILLGACLLPGLLWRPDDPHPYDVLVYHLQVPREWYEAGRMIPLRHNMYSFFPFNAEMHYWAAMYLRGGPWEGMYTAEFMSAGFAVLALLSVYAGARQLLDREKSRLGPILAAVLVASVPWVVMTGSVTYVESLLLLYTTLAIVWTIRALESAQLQGNRVVPPYPRPVLRERAPGEGRKSPDAPCQTSEALTSVLSRSTGRGGWGVGQMQLIWTEQTFQRFVLAGIMAGLAAGVKLTAAAMLLAAVPVAVIVAMLVRTPSLVRSRLLIGCAGFVVAGAIALSPWLVRNAAWTGNPLFPVGMKLLGAGHYSQVQVERFQWAHSAPEKSNAPGARIAAFGSQVLFNWQYGYLLWPLAVVGAVQQPKRQSTWICVLLLLMMAAVWIGFTHLIGRFFVPAIPVAAMLVAQIEWKRLRPLGIALVLLAAAASWLGPWGLHQRLVRFMNVGTMALALTDLRQLLPEMLDPVERDPVYELFMVGDSQAFLHQLPMSRLHYRTVFDLDTSNVDPNNPKAVLEAWTGAPLDSLPRGSVIYIDPQELLRLSETYYKVPMLPENLPGPRDRPFLIAPESIK